MPETDGVVTLRERVRERLAEIIFDAAAQEHPTNAAQKAADAILREFRLQPVAWGRVTEGEEVEGL